MPAPTATRLLPERPRTRGEGQDRTRPASGTCDRRPRGRRLGGPRRDPGDRRARRDGATGFRHAGTDQSPGTLLFTVIGDVDNPGVYELPLYTTAPVVESCAQCAACKLGCTAITDGLREIEDGHGTPHHLAQIHDRIPHITDQTRCALPQGEQLLVGGLLDTYEDEFVAHLDRRCTSVVLEQVPKIDHLDDATGTVQLDPTCHRKQPDWSYAPADATGCPTEFGGGTGPTRTVFDTSLVPINRELNPPKERTHGPGA